MATWNPNRFLESWSKELQAHGSRVRDLIGDKHWLSDGTHKESVLRTLISRHCPASILVTKGFVLSPKNTDCTSTEQDILIVDTQSEGPVFYESDLAIVWPSSVLAAVSVKSTARNDTICSAIRGLNSVRLAASGESYEPSRIWCGAFFFDESSSGDRLGTEGPSAISNAIRSNMVAPVPFSNNSRQPLGPNAMCNTNGCYIRIQYEQQENETRSGSMQRFGSAASASLFVADLLDHIAAVRGSQYSTLHNFVANALDVPMTQEDNF